MVKRIKAGSQDVVSSVDRLSDLPDGLIHTVFSFLPAPKVVPTCVLSRRWRSLWRTAPYINIDEKDFGIYRRSSRRDALKKRTRFEDFATKLLLFRDNTLPVGEFRLSTRVYNQRHVDQWIRRGFEYCPSVLNLILRYPRIKLPPVVASNVCHLKKLHLCGVDLDSHFTGLLCSSCPVLEDLELEHWTAPRHRPPLVSRLLASPTLSMPGLLLGLVVQVATEDPGHGKPLAGARSA
nr:unnamed protein product [Digitaria exilis]